jgi:arginine deiminase
MTEFGAHSEVGRLRKVMVHRPDLSLRRLTPSNHDDLLFDDVLWVERAQQEHDRFVALMRERGVEVYLLSDLLAEALAASDEGRERVIELIASEHTVGWSLVDDVRALLSALKPDELATHLIGGLTVAEAQLDVGAVAGTSLIGAALDDPATFVLPPLPNTLFTRDSSCWIYGGSPSTRCSGRPAAARPTTWPPSTGPTRCSPRRTSPSGTRWRAPTGGWRRRTSGWRHWRAATSCRSATAPSSSA